MKPSNAAAELAMQYNNLYVTVIIQERFEEPNIGFTACFRTTVKILQLV